MKDFEDSIKRITPSVSPADIERYKNWEREFGAR
jgi:SpoVK/Ycf46/Vps4 family AAA+-type ATPase